MLFLLFVFHIPLVSALIIFFSFVSLRLLFSLIFGVERLPQFVFILLDNCSTRRDPQLPPTHLPPLKDPSLELWNHCPMAAASSVGLRCQTSRSALSCPFSWNIRLLYHWKPSYQRLPMKGLQLRCKYPTLCKFPQGSFCRRKATGYLLLISFKVLATTHKPWQRLYIDPNSLASMPFCVLITGSSYYYPVINF